MVESYVKGMNNLNFQATGSRIKRCNEKVIPACESSPTCAADIVFLFDKSETNEAGLFDFKEKVTVITNWLEANTTLYRLGLIEFDLTSSAVLLSMSDNNRAAFETAVDGIVLGTGGTTIVEHRNSDEAFQRVIDDECGAWNSGSSKTVILVSQGLPHGGNESVDTADLTAQIAQVVALDADGVRVSTIAVPYYTFDETGNVPYFVSGLEGHLQYLAEQADGTFDSVQTNGPDDFNETLNVLVDAMMNSVSKVCGEITNDTATAGCCAVIPCDVCLQWVVPDPDDPYADPTIHAGVMSWGGSRWSGTVDGMLVEAYWDLRRHCVFFVEVDGVIVYTAARCATLDEYGNQIDPDEELAGCRAPDGRTTIERLLDSYETEIGELVWSVPIEYELPRRKSQQPQPCLWDVVFIVDTDDQNQFNTEQIQSGAIQPIVDWLLAQSDSVQFGLIEFDSTTAATVFGMSSDDAAFVTAVDALDSGTWHGTVDVERRSDLALGLAVGFTEWRSAAQKRIVIINQGTPTDPAELLDAYDHSDTARINGIQIYGMSVPFTSNIGDYTSLDSRTVSTNRYVSLHSGGSPLVGFAINETPPTIPTIILESLQSSEQCDTDGRCAEYFCGNCDCVPDELCVTIDGCNEIIPFTGEFCDGMATAPVWEGGGDCGYAVTIYLMRATSDYEDYESGISWSEGDCLFDIEIVGYEETFTFVLPVTCPDMTVTGTYRETGDDFDKQIVVTRNYCGVCGTKRCPCCASNTSDGVSPPIQGTIYAGFDTNGCVSGEYTGLINFSDCLGLATVQWADNGFQLANIRVICVEDENGDSAFYGVTQKTGSPEDLPPDDIIAGGTPGALLATPYHNWWKWESVSITCPQCPDIPGFFAAYSGINYQFCSNPPDPTPGGRYFGVSLSAVLDTFGTVNC